ncbi:MAG: Asp-tRNA(Asn)/Glu-tRNA(Gln) amidotransferase GatCAB subunit B, partial [Cyanobacteria bacterium J06632_3]
LKEGSSDYRYFPEPDLPPIEVSADQLKQWKEEMPELPAQKRHRYQEEIGLSAYDTQVMIDDRAVAEYFESAIATGASSKLVANWIMSDIAGYLNAEKLAISEIKLTPDALAEMVKLIEDGTISNKIGKDILPKLLKNGGSPKEIVEKEGLSQISDPAQIESMIDEVLEAHPDELAKFRAGKTKLKGFFVGQVMKRTGGRADPKLTNQLLGKKLSS